MATTTTDATTGFRRCIGSTRFGIEAHEAGAADFPVQPSQKDGLGRMCKPHWRVYVQGLREARMATSPKPAPAAPDEATAGGARSTPPSLARLPREGRRAGRRRRVKRAATARDVGVQRAEALFAEVDALPGPEHVRRNGDPDVQEALATVAAAHGQRTRDIARRDDRQRDRGD